MKAHTTKYKKLSLKIRYVTLEYQEVIEQHELYKQQFHERLVYLCKKCKTSVFNDNGKKVKKSSEPVVNNKTDKKQHKIFKDLYRDIAKATHPDKTGDDADKRRLLRHATKAKNTNDLITLLDICDDLEIDTPEFTEEHVDILEKNIKTTENHIRAIHKSDPWVWGEASEESRRKYEHIIFSPLTSCK